MIQRAKGLGVTVLQEEDLINLYGPRYSKRRIVGDSGRPYDQAQRQFFKNVGHDLPFDVPSKF